MYVCVVFSFLTLAAGFDRCSDGHLYDDSGSCEIDEADKISLLQTGLQRVVSAAVTPVVTSTEASKNAFLAASKPLKWMHVPKCGSSFISALVNVGCKGVPLDPKGVQHLTYVATPSLVQACSGLSLLPNRVLGAHFSISSEQEYETTYKGHGVIMLRQPEQRAISMYNYASEGGIFYDDPRLAGGMDRAAVANFWASEIKSKFGNHSEFLAKNAGCVVRMLTMPQLAIPFILDLTGWASCNCWGEHGTAPVPTVSQVQLAKNRLRGFAFVGILEEWELSMCLFHAMFGGRCVAEEFVDARPGQRSSKNWDTSVLEGVTDPYDGGVYTVGNTMFQERLKSYGVSHETCKPCYAEAAVTVG